MPDIAPIEVQDLGKRYGRFGRAVDALQGVSLAVAAGEIYGLLGRNGAGKTTLVKILLDIVRPSAGAATLLGRPAGEHEVRQRVGYLPEDHRFPEYQTGAGAMHFYARLSNVDAATRRRRIGELLELVDLTGAAHRRIRDYSKGMKQRLGLAQALVHDPDVLFLDEPTDGVDPVGRAEIRDVLLALKQRGKTVFLNSHLLSEVEQLCDRVGILEKGRLVREGTLAALTRTENVFRLRTKPELDDAQIDVLRQHAVQVTLREQYVEIGVASDSDIDPIVDWLRDQRIGLRELVLDRRSLEDVFLRAIRPEDGAPEAEA